MFHSKYPRPLAPLGLALGAFALALLPGCASRLATQSPAGDAAPGPDARATSEATTAYLFAHFTGESPTGEQIYFSVSEDGLHWHDLNNSEPVLVSTIGEKGVRDPALLRSADGKRFYLLATDLRIASGKGWGTAMGGGSTSLIIWESPDLVNWSSPWSVDVAGSIPQAGCAWAPEAIFDEDSGDYFVYWATISPRDGAREARVYYSRTRDFRSFTAPELYIERVEPDGKTRAIIDTQIIRVEGGRHRYYRASGDGQITFEAADALLGPWERVGDISHLGYTGKQLEGPILFQFNGEQKWALLADQYAAGHGYLPFVGTDLADTRSFRVLPASDYSLGTARKRHGGILNITRSEHEALLARWPSFPTRRLTTLDEPRRYLRHWSFRLRLDSEVTPVADARWRIEPGMSGADGAVSLRSANFPERFLSLSEGSLALVVPDGGSEAAANATFERVPGLADPAAFSLRIPGSADHYLLADGADLVIGSVRSEGDRRRATFREAD